MKKKAKKSRSLRSKARQFLKAAIQVLLTIVVISLLLGIFLIPAHAEEISTNVHGQEISVYIYGPDHGRYISYIYAIGNQGGKTKEIEKLLDPPMSSVYIEGLWTGPIYLEWILTDGSWGSCEFNLTERKETPKYVGVNYSKGCGCWIN